MQKLFNLVIIGRSGCGKGAQIELLEKRLKPVLAIHTGARFRQLVAEKNFAAGIAKKFLSKGYLAPSWLASYVWLNALMQELDGKKNLIFDGSPRMLGEAKLLDDVLTWFGRKKLIALYIDVGEKEAEKRLLLRGRGDDYTAAIKNRLNFFKKNVLPTINFYRATGRLIHIDGAQSVEAVSRDIFKSLKL